MKARLIISSLLGIFFISSVAVAGAIPSDNEPVAVFQTKLKAFAAYPSESRLRDLKVLCRQLPVRDLKPGQVGSGHPTDRDAKLTCMLQFLCVLDRLIAVPAPVIDKPSKPRTSPISFDYVPEDTAMIAYLNLHQHAKYARNDLARAEIPDFILYECKAVSRDHLRQLVVRELKADSDAYATQAALLQMIDPS